MAIKLNFQCLILVLVLVFANIKQCSAQVEENSCFGAGSIAASVILTCLFTVLLMIGIALAWKRYKSKPEHLILETDPEKGKGEFAFDNPGFKDTSILAIPKAVEKNQKLESKPKWNQWSPLNALSTKNEKRKTLDDSAIEGNEVKVVALRSHDFTGLGFNIEGNMKEGIYIKDILHRGPAFESGKLNSGDRINSVTISFEHMVYEDALTILSYASPYEVIIEARSGKLIHHTSGQGGQPSHPVYRSSSCTDLFQMEKSSKKRLFGEEHTGSLSSNYSSLQKSRSNMTTLERKESKSPKMRTKKLPGKHLSPEQLKMQLEQRISSDGGPKVKPQRVDAEMQKTEAKHQKFGIRVLPMDQQKSPKSSEQNENNVNIEKHQVIEMPIRGIDEVDELKSKPPQAKKREKKLESTPEKNEEFVRVGSGIKRDENGIPQEIPTHMLNAAVAARRNRKSSAEEIEKVDKILEKEDDMPKKSKGKAPAPPMNETKSNLNEIHSLKEDIEMTINKLDSDDTKAYNSDSDVETDNNSSVNTIELNSSDITIHQTEDEKCENRKTASTGDLTKIQKTRKSSSGTLERAQSLDITDTGIPGTLKRKAAKIELDGDEDLGKIMLNKEPRLSLILDGLNTFQRNRLKKSTEWGNMEDAILKLNQEDERVVIDPPSPEKMSFDFGEKSPEFSALVNKINEIKRESVEIELPIEVIDLYRAVAKQSEVKVENNVKNQIWPFNIDKPKNNGGIKETVEIKENIEENIPVQIKKEIVKEQKETTFESKLPKLNFKTESHKTNGVNKMELKPAYERRQQQNKKDQGMFYPPESNVDDEPKINVTSEKRQIKPPRVVEHEEITLTLNPEKEIIKNNDTDFDITEKWDVTVIETLEDTPMPKELFETITAVQPPEKHKRQRQPDVKSIVTLNTTEVIPDELKVVLNKEEVVSNKQEVVPIKHEVVPLKQEVTVLNSNTPDESKTVLAHVFIPNYLNLTQDFLFNEQMSCSQSQDTNISDDIKVSRHSHGSLERIKAEAAIPDDAKSVQNVSSIEVKENGDSALHSLELSINERSDFYTTALDSSAMNNDSTVTIVTPGTQEVLVGPTSLTFEIPSNEVTINMNSNDSKSSDDSKNSTMTYVTEIQVLTPNSVKNVSEVEISDNKNLDNEFEKYVNSFESRIEAVETNIPNFETSMEEFISNEPKSIVIEQIDPEKELHKIQEIAEEQLKKLPEMRFTTSYESKIPEKSEKRQSQIELLRSNFEKSPPKSTKTETTPTKSRIPIATTGKTPPMSPERRDSRNLDLENQKAILELMQSNSVHSTPMKYQLKSPIKNVTVTSIRTNSKIPSGLPTFGSRPPIPPKRSDSTEENGIQIATNGNGESSFKQWVFNPSGNNVSNIVVKEQKEK
ncbi:unnamed protein product [Brassicogethes aeneus]|uniref:PDZ domain-containing protein n=1 Tax=Brassicogethes aeneus TaxID=1431903 RepID=A0A9P0FC36_BRAAE|nr:unnamed protein product [Brassicogethes aeneus]